MLALISFYFDLLQGLFSLSFPRLTPSANRRLVPIVVPSAAAPVSSISEASIWARLRFYTGTRGRVRDLDSSVIESLESMVPTFWLSRSV